MINWKHGNPIEELVRTYWIESYNDEIPIKHSLKIKITYEVEELVGTVDRIKSIVENTMYENIS